MGPASPGSWGHPVSLGDASGAAQLKGVSPVAWTHVNFYGRYTFTEEPAVVPIEGFVETMAQYPFRATDLTSEKTNEG